MKNTTLRNCMKKDITNKLENFKKENEQFFEDYKNKDEVLKFIENINFNVVGLEESENGFKIYTNDFEIPDKYKIITRDFYQSFTDYGPYDPQELSSRKYSRVFEFYTKKNFGDINLEMILKDEWMSENELDVLLKYKYSPSEAGDFMVPQEFEKMIGFYKEKGMQEELLEEISEVMRIREEIIKH